MRKIVFFVLSLICIAPLFSSASVIDKELGLTKKLQYETSRVLNCSDNQVVLDEIYSYDWYIKVSPLNSHFLEDFNNEISNFKSINIKRERLQYIYDQQKSMQLAALVPNALSVATIALSAKSPKQTIIAVAGTALHTATSYLQTKKNTELEQLKSQWELDDQAYNVFNNLYVGLWSHLSEMANEYGYSNEDFASTKTISNFVKEMDELKGQHRDIITVCKRYEEELSSYPEFWRTLAIASYELGFYQEALDYVSKYEDCYLRVFYHDPDNAHLLLIKAYCIDALEKDPVEKTLKLEKIVDEIIKDQQTSPEPAKQYYCYFVYKDLFKYTGDESYLEKAWQILNDMLYSCTKEYEKDLKSFFCYDYIESGKKEIDDLIAKNNTEIANLKEQKKNSGSRAKKDDFDLKIEKINNRNKELNENREHLEKSIDQQTPPSEAFLISLTKEYMDLSRELNKKSTTDYRLRLDDLREIVQDDYFRCAYLGEILLGYEVNATFKDNYKVMGIGNDIDELVFSLPLSFFTMVEEDFSEMKLHINDRNSFFDIVIPYADTENTLPSWSYRIVRPEGVDSSEWNMYNTTIEFTVNTKGHMVELKKGEEIPSIYFTFESDNNQLERKMPFSFDVKSLEALKKGFFKFVK